ncbi:hypothetical protein [Thermomonas haemolytica]|uniref:hypothetical protein n=1 Tax=Thermomonas haemolytica TaxID=141949 RepID=UPI0010461EB8|nr:hypothetical protein [Thermomonas haemolytica]
MSLQRLVKWLLSLSWSAFAVSIVAQAISAVGVNAPVQLYVALFLSAFVIGGVTGIIQFKIVLIERDWWLGSRETLLRRFPIWIAALCIALGIGIVAQAVFLPSDYSHLSLALVFAIEAGALTSLSRQPWLLTKHTCQNGHKVSFYNRFCPTCGVLLLRSSERA